MYVHMYVHLHMYVHVVPVTQRGGMASSATAMVVREATAQVLLGETWHPSK